VFSNVEVIHNYFQESNKSLEKCVPERKGGKKQLGQPFRKQWLPHQRKKLERLRNYLFLNRLKEI
jgi:hypothetical protein